MTIETVVNKTIQSGNGSNKDFDFAFEIPNEDSLSLTKRAADGTETAITTNYTVTGIGNESGGTVNYPTSGSALTSNEKIIIKRVVSLKQLENLRNQGDYSLEDIEDALDYAVMICQQLQEQIDRCLKLNLTSSSTYVNVADFVANKLLVVSSDGQSIEMSSASYGSIDAYLSTLVAIAADISAVAAIDTDVSAVAAIDTDVSAVAAIVAAVSTVASIDSDVSQVSSIHAAVSTVAGISANVTTVAGISANVTTVAGIASAVSAVAAVDDEIVIVAAIASAVSAVSVIAANVTTVAGIAANVTTVAGIAAAVSSCATNMTSIQNAASFGFPTLASGDEYKILQIKADRTGYNAVEAVSRRNAIINGAFDIWQENSSFTSAANGTYTADMWVYGKQGAMVHDISRSTDVPTVAQAGRLFNYSALIDCQTVDSSIGSTDICAFEQKIEGYNWLPLAQKALVLSFWVKATKTGTYCVSLRNNRSGTPDRSYVAEYTVNASDTWEFKTIIITASPSAGTWNYTNGNGCSLSFCLAGGSSFQTTAGAWQTGNYLCTSNQVNACDSTSNNFRVTAVQLEVGSLPTPFEGRTFQEERRLCQRYWESSYEYGSAPGTSSDNGKFSYMVSSAGSVVSTVPFKVVKRTTSTNTFYSTTGASGNLRNETSSADTAASPIMSSETGVGINKGGLTSGHTISGHFVANARL